MHKVEHNRNYLQLKKIYQNDKPSRLAGSGSRINWNYTIPTWRHYCSG